MPGQPKVFAVTVNWKRCEDTLECIRSLGQCGIDGIGIIVVDNGSGDGSAERIRNAYPDVSVIENGSNEGYAKAANQGVRYSLERGATHILLINNDAVGNPGFLAELMDGFRRHEKAGLLGCNIFYYGNDKLWYGGGSFNRWLGYTRHIRMDERDCGRYEDFICGYVTGCILLVRSEVFQTIGFFDEVMGMYSEDLDLSLRAIEAGYECWHIPRASAQHKVSMSSGVAGTNEMTPFRSFYYSRNLLLAVVKNQRGVKRLLNAYSNLLLLPTFYFFRIKMDHTRGSYHRYVAGLFDGLVLMVRGLPDER